MTFFSKKNKHRGHSSVLEYLCKAHGGSLALGARGGGGQKKKEILLLGWHVNTYL